MITQQEKRAVRGEIGGEEKTKMSKILRRKMMKIMYIVDVTWHCSMTQETGDEGFRIIIAVHIPIAIYNLAYFQSFKTSWELEVGSCIFVWRADRVQVSFKALNTQNSYFSGFLFTPLYQMQCVLVCDYPTSLTVKVQVIQHFFSLPTPTVLSPVHIWPKLHVWQPD